MPRGLTVFGHALIKRVVRAGNAACSVYSGVLMKKLFLLLLPATLPALAGAAILPDTIGAWQKGAATAAAVPDQKLWQEYGLQDSETAPYAANGQKYTISAYRFNDAAGVLGAFYQVRPPDASPLQLTGMGAANASDQIVAVGNYLFIFKGYKPKPRGIEPCRRHRARSTRNPRSPSFPATCPPDSSRTPTAISPARRA